MRGRPDEHGIALLMVISALAILSLLGVALAGQARTQARLARNLAETAHARAVAESGVSLAVFHLIGADWLPDRAVHAVAYDNGTVRITIEDESGKVDLVQGPDAIIANLLDRLAIGDSERAALLGAIDDRRRASAKARAASFDALEALVPSDARALAERLQPYATVYTHSSQIDPMTAPPLVLAAVPGMEAQLRLQLEASEKLRGIRKQHGSLTFGSVETTPVLQNGEVMELAVSQRTMADEIIENFMVAANVAMAQFLKGKGSLSIRRVVKIPKRWDGIQVIAAKFGVTLPAVPDPRALSAFLDQRKAADPAHFQDLSLSVVKLLGPGEYIVEPPGAAQQGHFGLGEQDYTHSTAPNRRYADLVTQRLLKAASASAAGPYSETELSAIAARCTEREDAARKVERLMRKVAAASLLNRRIGEVFDGIITGASPKGTYVRLLKFPAEGMVVRGAQGIDVGDSVRVRLASVDVAKGFIDFERK